MNRILITSGPTREYLDPVRYLTNASSGQMGAALAESVLRYGGLPVIVSGCVSVMYPAGAEVYWAETTEQMQEQCLRLFPACTGIIGAAAPCDFRPVVFSKEKISKPKDARTVSMVFSETPDILASAGTIKRPEQWSIAFALETEQGQRPQRALEKMKRKNCDFVVLNSPESIGRAESSFYVFDAGGELRITFTGSKRAFAEELLRLVL
ncbi:MAG: phosphopantothenoylcysteine decarboxylase [Planctomycetaceae bacterium]|jgi:phosphopantothenoylcysteine decarboxylase/phosphopantothenate--cysteine ligase|nr:phosphopantothenoylcysteine decarboxylase [Planctomycetaceae bacterium]